VVEVSESLVEITMSQAINRALAEAFERDEPIMHLGQDLGAYGGTFGVTRGLWERFGPDVVRDGPLCESGTLGFGIGLAISGVRAIVEVEFFDFVGVCMDQIYNQAAKLHYLSGGRLRVPLVIRAPIAARLGGGPQHSQSLESWFMHIPGIKIAMPSNAQDAYDLMRSALDDQNPVLYIENVRLYGRRRLVDIAAPPRQFGEARVVREGTDVTVVALSALVDEAVKAAEALAARGVSVEVIDPRTLVPLDLDTILASLRRTMHLVVAHDGHKTCGFGAELAALCSEHAFDYLDAPVQRVAALDVPIPCGPGMDLVYPDAATIEAGILTVLGLAPAA
jgi:acetoin:2,6-dichlorophenolindophenol oxidoreductase subunit beta